MSEKRIILILCGVTTAALVFSTGLWLGGQGESSFVPYDIPSSTISGPEGGEISFAVSSEASEQVVFPIDLNTATLEELQALPGIGEKTAEKILAYRIEHGFTMKEELMQVDGIGEKKFETIRELVFVEP